MSAAEVDLYVYYRPDPHETIEERHQGILDRMSQIGPPLGAQGLDLPPVPDFGKELISFFRWKYPIKGLSCSGSYKYRYPGLFERDQAVKDDSFSIHFKVSNKFLNYAEILHAHFPKIIEAFQGYRGVLFFGSYSSLYAGGFEQKNPIYNRLLEDENIDVNGRNNIFTLSPAQYWDRILCERALGYGPEEVIRRLQGLVPRVQPLMDGVYVVFNDNPELSFEDFVAFNDKFKPILGLI